MSYGVTRRGPGRPPKKRGPGRPRKSETVTTAAKRPVGRPRKNQVEYDYYEQPKRPVEIGRAHV